MQYSLITLLLIFFGISLISAIELCDKTVDSDLPYYVNPKIQNCGCEETSCIRKCCKLGYSLERHRVCRKINGTDTFNFPVYKKKETFSKNVSNGIFLVGDLECAYYKLINSDPDDKYFVQENGLLWLPNVKAGIFYENSQYCIDNVNGLSAFVCSSEETNRLSNIVGMIISMPFLLATFLVYALLPDRNVHQKALMLYVLTLCIFYILIVTINLAESPSSSICKIMGYSTLFFFLVSFFWMNVISFDIWYTFSGGRGFIDSKRSSERKRFLLYSIYAWGVPLILITIVYCMQLILPEESEHNPGIGVSKCFVADGYPSLWYLYGEAAILLIANIVFFLRTALQIRRVKKETSLLTQNDCKRHAYDQNKQKFNLYLKLLLGMGVNWSMEVVSWAVLWQTNNRYMGIWYVTDFINAAYGVFIFFIFVYKKKHWKDLQKRYYNFIGKPQLAHVTSLKTRTSLFSTTDTSVTDKTKGARPEEAELRRVP